MFIFFAVQLVDCLKWRVNNKIDNILAVSNPWNYIITKGTIYSGLIISWYAYGFLLSFDTVVDESSRLRLLWYCIVAETNIAEGQIWPYSTDSTDWILWLLQTGKLILQLNLVYPCLLRPIWCFVVLEFAGFGRWYTWNDATKILTLKYDIWFVSKDVGKILWSLVDLPITNGICIRVIFPTNELNKLHVHFVMYSVVLSVQIVLCASIVIVKQLLFSVVYQSCSLNRIPGSTSVCNWCGQQHFWSSFSKWLRYVVILSLRSLICALSELYVWIATVLLMPISTEHIVGRPSVAWGVFSWRRESLCSGNFTGK